MPDIPPVLAKLAAPPMRLVVVSNRTAAPGKPRAGGLAVALGHALAERGGLWFGWSGAISDDPGVRLVSDRPGRGADRGSERGPHRGVDYALADLTRDEHEGYYLGYANRVLWPLMHYRVDLTEFDEGVFACYAAVNRRFAGLLAPLLRAEDLVWVHDYQLMLLGRELRRAGWRGVAGFFLHIPFPAPEIFAALPQHAELARALVEFDLVGFQTEHDAANFGRYMVEFHGAAEQGGMLRVRGRAIRVGTFPAGIDHDEFAALARSGAARQVASRLGAALGERQLVLGVDRLDYTKGLPQRLRAFERLLDRNPDLHHRVSLLQIASPSRSQLPSYRALASEVDRIAGRINGAFGGFDWTPVQHLARCYPRAAIGGFCRLARVGLVTPLHDGMNLVAKEYVAAQDPADPGVLVLSRFAGAADQLGAALPVNPHDADEVAAAIRRALDMSLAERRRRWEALAASVSHEDASWWQRSFIGALQAARPAVVPLARAPAEDLAAAG